MTQYELPELAFSPDARLDIVVVPGLRDSVKLWTAGEASWLEDLSKDVPARILAFGYESNIPDFSPEVVAKERVEEHVTALCRLVKLQATERPIVLVAHSFGGILCAQALVMGNRSENGGDVQTIAKRIRGMVFLGTPFPDHSQRKWIGTIARIVKLRYGTDEGDDEDFQENCEKLFGCVSKFPEELRKLKKGIETMSFYETAKTDGIMIVDESSTTILDQGKPIPIDADHVNICRFKGREDPGYKSIVDAVRRFVQRGEMAGPPGAAGTTINVSDQARVGALAGRDQSFNAPFHGLIEGGVHYGTPPSSGP